MELENKDEEQLTMICTIDKDDENTTVGSLHRYSIAITARKSLMFYGLPGAIHAANLPGTVAALRIQNDFERKPSGGNLKSHKPFEMVLG